MEEIAFNVFPNISFQYWLRRAPLRSGSNIAFGVLTAKAVSVPSFLFLCL
jgi:hypothetical protein